LRGTEGFNGQIDESWRRIQSLNEQIDHHQSVYSITTDEAVELLDLFEKDQEAMNAYMDEDLNYRILVGEGYDGIDASLRNGKLIESLKRRQVFIEDAEQAPIKFVGIMKIFQAEEIKSQLAKFAVLRFVNFAFHNRLVELTHTTTGSEEDAKTKRREMDLIERILKNPESFADWSAGDGTKLSEVNEKMDRMVKLFKIPSQWLSLTDEDINTCGIMDVFNGRVSVFECLGCPSTMDPNDWVTDLLPPRPRTPEINEAPDPGSPRSATPD
jgi:hypothetical protein